MPIGSLRLVIGCYARCSDSAQRGDPARGASADSSRVARVFASASGSSTNRLAPREVHELADRDPAGSPQLKHPQCIPGRPLVEPCVTEQGSNRGKTDRVTPNRPREGETTPSTIATDDGELSSRAAQPWNDGQGGEADGSQPVGSVLRRLLGLRIGWVGGAQRVTHVLVRVPSERERRVRARPRLEQRLAQAIGFSDGGLPAAGAPGRRHGLPRDRGQARHEVHVSLAKQQTKRSRLGLLRLVLDTNHGIAGQGRPQVRRVPIRGHGFAESLGRFRGRQLQVLESAEIMAVSQVGQPLCNSANDIVRRRSRDDGQRRANRRRVDRPGDAGPPGGSHVFERPQRAQQSQEGQQVVGFQPRQTMGAPFSHRVARTPTRDGLRDAGPLPGGPIPMFRIAA